MKTAEGRALMVTDFFLSRDDASTAASSSAAVALPVTFALSLCNKRSQVAMTSDHRPGSSRSALSYISCLWRPYKCQQARDMHMMPYRPSAHV